MLRISFLILLISFSSSLSQRISDQKCTEYKNLIKSNTSFGSLSLLPSTSREKAYKCGGVGFSGLILGGVKANLGEYPHAAAIGWRSRYGSVEFKCGGSLISERFVLTAAHCASDDLGPPQFVRFGDQNLSNDFDKAVPVEVNIRRFIKHPQYDSNTNTHDIALIELVGKVTFNLTTIRPGCLQQTEFSGKNVTAIGWGKISNFGTTSDELMKVSLPINDIGSCEYYLEHDYLDSSRQICAGGERHKDTCQGDSGAPIQIAHSDAACVYDIIGLTSFGGSFCGRKAPAVYTKVKYYLDWIEETVWPQPRRTNKYPTASHTDGRPVWK